MGMFGPVYDKGLDGVRLRTQLEVIRDVMVQASDCGAWLTLREIAQMTRYGEASISAQLRHLRKRQFGGYLIEKRRRGVPTHGVWEYRLLRGATPPQLEFKAYSAQDSRGWPRWHRG